jgi:hypothetical protein
MDEDSGRRESRRAAETGEVNAPVNLTEAEASRRKEACCYPTNRFYVRSLAAGECGAQ